MRSLAWLIAAIVLALGSQVAAMASDDTPCAAARTDDAIAQCRAAVAKGNATPRDLAKALWVRGRDAARADTLDAALADLDAAIAADPTLAVAFNSRGVVYRRQRQYDKALADLDSAIRLEPKSAIFFANRGRTFHEMHDLEKAMADYDHARSEACQRLVQSRHGAL